MSGVRARTRHISSGACRALGSYQRPEGELRGGTVISFLNELLSNGLDVKEHFLLIYELFTGSLEVLYCCGGVGCALIVLVQIQVKMLSSDDSGSLLGELLLRLFPHTDRKSEFMSVLRVLAANPEIAQVCVREFGASAYPDRRI